MTQWPESESNWFTLSNELTTQTNQKIADFLSETDLSVETKFFPQQAHWFLCDTLLLANQANREGMHANALSLTRQCIEAISIIELGLCKHNEAEAILVKWNNQKISAGEIRRWLESNVWSKYGTGLWAEPWNIYFAKLSRAVQPYAHYSSQLAQWQHRLVGNLGESTPEKMIIEIGPRQYDPQKATRITLFHVLITYTMSRIWLASSGIKDRNFESLVLQAGEALGKSTFLDGHQTNWEQQFWATVLFDGQPMPKGR